MIKMFNLKKNWKSFLYQAQEKSFPNLAKGPLDLHAIYLCLSTYCYYCSQLLTILQKKIPCFMDKNMSSCMSPQPWRSNGCLLNSKRRCWGSTRSRVNLLKNPSDAENPLYFYHQGTLYLFCKTNQRNESNLQGEGSLKKMSRQPIINFS